jgi:hypothetical protein
VQGRETIVIEPARGWQLSLLMRSLVLLLAIGACTEDGANLVFSAPNGPKGAATYKVVLASTDDVAIIPDQRVSPTATTAESVTYYLQRTSANHGAVASVDGFRVQIEPAAAVPVTSFIPFVLFFDAQQQLIGVGAYHPNGAGPSPIEVVRGKIDEYTLDVEPVTEVVDRSPVGASQAMQVACTRDDATTFRSGVVWRTPDGAELRLLLPSDGTGDATTRALDLDCDGQTVAAAATSEDCDDTRARFHTGAEEVCDGEDTNCDASQYSAVPCTNAATACGGSTAGTALCDQATQTVGTCSTDVACACAPGSVAASECRRCVLGFEHGSNNAMQICEPAIDATVGMSGLCTQTPCTMTVVSTTGGWQATVATTSQGMFAATAVGVVDAFALRVARPDPTTTSGGGSSVGTIDLAVTTGTGPRLISLDLELSSVISSCDGGGPFAMTCSP